MKSFNNIVDAAYQYIKQHHAYSAVSSEDAIDTAIQSSGRALSPEEKQEALDMVAQARETYYSKKRSK